MGNQFNIANLKRVSVFERQSGGFARLTPVTVPTPPAAPVEPAKPAAPARPSLYIIEEYQLVTIPGDIGVTRNVVGTINLPGNSKKTLYVKSKHTEASAGTISQTALESQDQATSKNLSDSISSNSEESHDTDASDFKFDGSFHGEVNIGFMSDSADADAHASTSSREVRDGYKDAVKKSTDQQIADTAEYRKESSVSVSESNQTTSEGESIETFEIDNSQNAQTQNYLLCQLAVERLTALCLVNAKIGFYDAAKGETLLKPLSSLVSLVENVIVPEHRKEVLAGIVKQLETVFDFEDEPKKFIRQSTDGSLHFYQVIPNLTSEITIPRGDGSKKKFTVPGIAIQKYDNILAIPQIGLARGTA